MGQARSARLAAVAVALLLVASCSQVRWVKIMSAVGSADSTSMRIVIDGCATPPYPTIVETDTEVRLRIDLKLDHSSGASCAGFVMVNLGRPLGTRRVIDDRSGAVVPVENIAKP